MSDPTMSEFIAAAASSLTDAQGGPTSDGISTQMTVAEARLEARVVLSTSDQGITLRTIPVTDITSGAVAPSALSTVRLDFVAISEELDPGVGRPPDKSRAEVIKDLAGRADIKSLDRVLGGLTYDARFLDDRRRWLVTAVSGNTVVRESLISDERP